MLALLIDRFGVLYLLLIDQRLVFVHISQNCANRFVPYILSPLLRSANTAEKF